MALRECERAVILKNVVQCIVIARVVCDDAGAACVPTG
jgi:hypothetical protein